MLLVTSQHIDLYCSQTVSLLIHFTQTVFLSCLYLEQVCSLIYGLEEDTVTIGLLELAIERVWSLSQQKDISHFLCRQMFCRPTTPHTSTDVATANFVKRKLREGG